MPRKNIAQAQFLESKLIVFQVDGSVVTTGAGVNTGLLVGLHVATILKGTGADSNLVTITLNRPYGIAPSVMFQPRTLDCECRLDVDTTKTVIKVRTLKSSDLTAKVDDADFTMLVFGTEGIYEGSFE